jgi:hypothetical protein
MKDKENNFEVVPRYLTASNIYGETLRMIHVESSMVTHFGIAGDSLFLRYKGHERSNVKTGMVYEYERIPADHIAGKLLRAVSVGKEIHTQLFNDNAPFKSVNYRRRKDLEREFAAQYEECDNRRARHDTNVFENGVQSGFEMGQKHGLMQGAKFAVEDEDEAFKRVFGFYPEEIQSLYIDLEIHSTGRGNTVKGSGSNFLFGYSGGNVTDQTIAQDIATAMNLASELGMVNLPPTDDLDTITQDDLVNFFREVLGVEKQPSINPMPVILPCMKLNPSEFRPDNPKSFAELAERMKSMRGLKF